MPKLELLPAVDVEGGQAVRLVQGAAGSQTSYGDPLQAALAWQAAGAQWVHLVDLDAAFGRGSNAGLLGSVVRRLDIAVELSGGIRDDDSLAAALATGCERVNIGTAALERPDWVRSVIASGGVSSLADLREIASLASLGVEGAIVGKALYAGKFTLEQALQAVAA